jgi:hypothetical protein
MQLAGVGEMKGRRVEVEDGSAWCRVSAVARRRGAARCRGTRAVVVRRDEVERRRGEVERRRGEV